MTATTLFRRSALAAAVVLSALSPVAAAQMVQPIPGTRTNDPADVLSMHLRTLAAAPRSLSALLGAGRAALEVGDPNAALGFFARADEIDPRNGQAKAGLASALVLLERPDDALRLFGEAAGLGVSEADLAGDRGLAYDLRGDNRRAQRDYAAAMRSRPDDEVTRRYALSLGISGDRDQALAMLDPLLRKQDQGAWRARAFILAMNGDLPGANGIARQVMPANLAGTMTPFLTRLTKLNSAERAHAVNFGTMPSDGQSFASVQLGDPFRPAGSASVKADVALIPSGRPLGPVTAPVRAVTRPPANNVRPLGEPRPSAIAIVPRNASARVGTRIAAVDRSQLPPEARGEGSAPVRVATNVLPPPDAARSIVSGPVTTPQRTSLTGPPADAMSAPVFEVATPTVARVAPPPAAVAVSPPAAPMSRLAAILAGITPETESAPVALPSAAEVRAARRVAAKKAADAATAAVAEKAVKDAKAAELAAARANPARLWVQVATGSNEAGLATTWKRIRDSNATLLKPYAGYSAPFKATNRVLAGPVKSSSDARTLVNALAKAGVSATTFTSEAGQEVIKLGAK